ncbi:MAG TPA: tetratricopeptide repeat protein [Steroidobacteraceae bacterium]|nr:tetratricopeptide repeat protein [Steroidobacteraceae bacterium]
MLVADSDPKAKALYRYRFGSAEFDEARFELNVAGLPVDMERKPLEVLALLLKHAGEVVTKEELLEVVWARPTVDNVISNAITKLRNGLGDDNAAQIVTLPRVGYRFAGPVKRVAVGRTLVSNIEFVKGGEVPLRPDFRFESLLNKSNNSEVWLARHIKTTEQRVYKFATDNERLSTLKREVTLFRLLRESLGERGDLVRILDWNFATPPYFIECEYGGENLGEWAVHQDGLRALSLEQRIDLLLQIADVVAAAHDVGVLHKDIKPANVLITSKSDGTWQIRLTDFGSGRILDPQRIADLDITQLGFTVTTGVGDSTSGTLLYLAPELMMHQAPTIKSDIFALGIMLYQLIVANVRRPMMQGWERDVEDEMLREDVRAATDGDPTHRLSSVHELIERLRGRDMRRLKLQQERQSQSAAHLAMETLRRAQARKPWMIAAIAILVAGMAISSLLYVHALHVQQQLLQSQAQAEKHAMQADAVTEFLDSDVFSAADPFFGDFAQHRTLKEAMTNATVNVNNKFTGQPLMEATVRMTLGRIFDHMMDNTASEPQWRRAITLLTEAGEIARPQLLQSQYALAEIFSRRSEFDLAAKELADTDDIRHKYQVDDTQTLLMQHESWGLYFYVRQQVDRAIPHLIETLRLLLQQPSRNFVAIDRNRMMLGDCYIAANRLREAEQLSRELLQELRQRHIPSDLTIAQAKSLLGESLVYQHRYQEAEPLINQSYQTVAAILGPKERLTLNILKTRCDLYSAMSRRIEALQCAQQSYKLARVIYGEHHYAALMTLLDVGNAQYALYRYAAAERSITDAHSGLIQTLGTNNPLTQHANYILARCLLQLHRDTDRLRQLVQALDARTLEGTEPGAPWELRLQLLRGLVLLAQGQPVEAQPLLMAAVQLSDDADPTDTILSEARLALRHTNSGKDDQRLAAVPEEANQNIE